MGSPTTPHIRGLGSAPRLVRLQASTGKGYVEPPWPLMAPGTTRGPQGGVGSNAEAFTSAQAWPEQTRLSLVSGFGPFRQHLVNSSWEAVKVQSLRAQTQELRVQLIPSVVLENPAYSPLGDQSHMGGERTHTACPGTRSRLWSLGVTHLHPGAHRAQQ